MVISTRELAGLTPGGTPETWFTAWRPVLANYRKPAPVFVKQRLKLTASASPTLGVAADATGRPTRRALRPILHFAQHFDFHAEPLAARATNMTAAKGQAMSDRVLFSMGGVSMIFAFMALAMFWPV